MPQAAGKNEKFSVARLVVVERSFTIFHTIFFTLVSPFIGNEERPPIHNQQAAVEDGKANQDAKGNQQGQVSNENKGNKGKGGNNKSRYRHKLFFFSLGHLMGVWSSLIILLSKISNM